MAARPLTYVHGAGAQEPVAAFKHRLPNDRSAKDERVNNPAPDNHDLAGYLSVSMVRSTIIAAAG